MKIAPKKRKRCETVSRETVRNGKKNRLEQTASKISVPFLRLENNQVEKCKIYRIETMIYYVANYYT